MPGALDWLMRQLGDDQASQSNGVQEPMVRQDAQGNWVPYTPPSTGDALQKLQDTIGVTDLTAAKQAFDRGEYPQALGQGVWGAGQLAGAAAPVVGAVGKFAPAVGRTLPSLLADEVGALKLPGGGPIRAYHGSPHDFDRFDSSKIGTGEGAQAYGHGLYFAESEPVAKSYRNDLSNGLDITIGGKQLIRRGELVGTTGNAHADELLVLHDGNVEQALRGMWMPDPDAIRTLRRLKGRVEAISPGKMYEVDLHADPARLLDWDRPLSEQGPQVRQILDREWLANPDAHANQSGGTIYDKTAKQAAFNIGRGDFDYPGASEILREAGIPGVKYLDQGSRNAGAGSSNYVMFDDKLIEILRKYGLAGLTAGTGAAALGGSAEAAPADALDRIRRQLGEGAF